MPGRSHNNSWLSRAAKKFSGLRRARKIFLLSASVRLELSLLPALLQPLTANSDYAHGGQPKATQLLSAGRHFFILGPGSTRRKEQDMERICENCQFYKEEERWCKAFGGFTHTWPDDSCSAWTEKKQLWDLCELCQHYGKECPGHKDDGTAYTCYAYRKAKEE